VSVCLLCTKHEHFRKSDIYFLSFKFMFLLLLYIVVHVMVFPKSSTCNHKAIVTLYVVLILFFRVLYNNLVLSLIYVKDVDEWMRVIFKMGHILLILCNFA